LAANNYLKQLFCPAVDILFTISLRRGGTFVHGQ